MKKYLKCAQCRFLVKPELLISERRNNVMNLSRDLDINFKTLIENLKHNYEMINARLVSLDPKGLLKRGYIMVTNKAGKIVNSIAAIKKGENLQLGFLDGNADVIVENISSDKKE